MARWLWQLKRIISTLWFRATIFGIIGVITAMLAFYFRHAIPEDVSQKIGADAVDSLLNIIASSMLAVTTFSLSTMVAAYSAATTNVTPRSTKLLLEDKVSQTALSTFLGAFIYSLVGIVALKIGIYGSSGRLILFVVTIMVLAVIVLTLIRWIEYLSRLGRVSETINRVEQAARRATMARIKSPYLGGVKLKAKEFTPPEGAHTITSKNIGYIQFIDMDALSAIAEQEEGQIYIQSLPGAFVTPSRTLAYITGIDAEKFSKKIEQAFVTSDDRSFEQDPRFGMIVLSEIASRALSPAINDPGTAIDVIGTSVRVLALWGDQEVTVDEGYAPQYPRVHVAPLAYQDIFDDIFLPIARDGAGMWEVALAVQKALIALSHYPDAEFRAAAIATSKKALLFAEQSMRLPAEVEDLRAYALSLPSV